MAGSQQISPGSHGTLTGLIDQSSHLRRPLELDDRGRSRFRGCSNIRDYEVLGKLGEGTFGEVHKARSRKNGSIVALKKILMHNEKDGFPITALREIKLLKMLSHVNVLKLEEMAIERNKAANLLINNHGILQIADFGLARHYDEKVPKPGSGGGEASRDYTTLVVTRWYRPPELLLQLRRYTTAIDMWGVGCVFGEMFQGKPILAGNSDINQAQIIFDLVGSPTEDNMPGWSSLPGCEGVKSFKERQGNLRQTFREQGSGAISLLSELLKLDWRTRINAIDALQHSYFRDRPLPARPGDIPRFEESHELDRRKFRGQKAALPPAPAGGTVGTGPNGEWAGGTGPPNGATWADGPGNRRGVVGEGGGWGGAVMTGYGPQRGGYEPRPPAMHHGGRGPPMPPGHPGPLGFPGPSGPPGLPGHRPPWMRDGQPPRPNGNGAGRFGQDWAGDVRVDPVRDRIQPRGPAPGPGGSRMDTYIPNYSGGDGARDRGDRNRRDEWVDRGRVEGERRDYGNRYNGRPRSRSPGMERDRARNRERERDLYRR
ncbi:MAG: serine/threonine protein kinase, CMGC, CDC2/CDK sub [Candelina mexicana]|nr:MAG: serine/threonine protein kinase, CMGC, CDC2/CDK sub [Candelina mexicana]